MTELRRRMDNDMVLRGMAERTREAYLASGAGARAALSPVAGSDHRGGGAGLPAGSAAGAPARVEYRQHRGARAAVLLSRDAEARPGGVFDSRRTAAGQGTAHSEHRGRPADSGGDVQSQAPRDAGDRVRGGPARQRVGPSAGDGHRLGAHDDSRGAGQGREGPLHAAVGAPAGRVAGLLARGTDRGRGSLRPGGQIGPWIRRGFSARTRRPSGAPASPSAAGFTACGMPSRRICSKPASTCRPFSACSGIAPSARPHTISTWRIRRCWRIDRRWICSTSPRRPLRPRRREPCASRRWTPGPG